MLYPLSYERRRQPFGLSGPGYLVPTEPPIGPYPRPKRFEHAGQAPQP